MHAALALSLVAVAGAVTGNAAANPLPAGDPAAGQALFRACAVCHTLTPDGGRRAGPTLWRLFGRKGTPSQGARHGRERIAQFVRAGREHGTALALPFSRKSVT